MPSTNKALVLWRTLSNKPGGRWAFTRAMCLKAPYFASIHPAFEALEPEYARVSMKKRRSVTNHIGTVHAIAMCNMAELAGGLLTEVTVPTSHRWIPKGMTVEYLAKAGTDLVAEARPRAALALDEPGDYVVDVDVRDTHGTSVFHAAITMWVSPKKKAG